MINNKTIFQELTFLSTGKVQKHLISKIYYPKEKACQPKQSPPLFQVPVELHDSTRTVVKAYIVFIFSTLLIYSGEF